MELGGGGERVEGGDGFDKAGDGEGVADAAGLTDEVQSPVFAAEGNGHADERGDAGAVNLGDTVEVDDDLAGAVLKNGAQGSGELIARVPDGETAVEVKNVYAVLFANVDFNGRVLSHRNEVRRKALYDEARHATQMRLRVKHKWNVSTAKARKIQEELRGRWVGEDRLREIRTVAGLDAAFVLTGSQTFKAMQNRWAVLREANQAIAAVVVYKYPEMEELERAYAKVRLEFPYVPGFLSFREIPALLAALAKLKTMPGLFFCDGQGYAHPRRMGLASHLGIVLDRPTIGCAKSILIGTHGSLGDEQGAWAALKDGEETIGAALRTRAGANPVYVSQGHRVSLETALRLTLAVSDGRRVPRPTRDADRYVREVKRMAAGSK